MTARFKSMNDDICSSLKWGTPIAARPAIARIVMVAAALLSCLAQEHLLAQHGHLNAGATGKNQGDALYFANGDDFIMSSG